MPRKFTNLDGSGPQPFSSVLRWALLDPLRGRRKKKPAGRTAPVVTPDLAALRTPPAPGSGVRLTWLGHASWLVQLDGTSLLIDPVLGKRVGGVVKRLAPLPIGVADLPKIDAQLITHSHYDHLDLPTVKRVGAPVITGTAMGRYFGKKLPVRELAWWESTRVGAGERGAGAPPAWSATGGGTPTERGTVSVTFVPSQHWSNRGFDMNETLWGGFVIEGSAGKVYHSGDTAWFDGFAEIGRRFPKLDVALLPIGAYEPEWFMRRQHMNPEDTVNAFVALGAKRCFAMHWGTYQLTDEPLAEPPAKFLELWKSRGLPIDAGRLLAIGETARI